MNRLPDEIKASMQGAVPSTLVTCAKDGTPNISVVSQVYYVDPERVAVSFQFFNKTIRNVRENPAAKATLIDPTNFDVWRLDLRFDHSETEGRIFDEMDMQIEAIASMTGMSGIFKLKAADIYRVLRVERIKTTH